MAWWKSAGKDSTDELEADAAALGVILDPASLEPERRVVRVPPDARPAIEVFLMMDTQWRSGPGGVIGLDYNVAPMVADAVGAGPAAGWLSDLRMIESKAAQLINERLAKGRAD